MSNKMLGFTLVDEVNPFRQFPHYDTYGEAVRAADAKCKAFREAHRRFSSNSYLAVAVIPCHCLDCMAKRDSVVKVLIDFETEAGLLGDYDEDTDGVMGSAYDYATSEASTGWYKPLVWVKVRFFDEERNLIDEGKWEA